MAREKKERPAPSIGQVAGSGDEARKRAKIDERNRASKFKVARILLPHEAETGQWDADKVLKTTLGMPKGQTRDITQADLAAFKENMRRVRMRWTHGVVGIDGEEAADKSRSWTPGITPRQVIAHALETRRERARKEIHMAVPVFGNTLSVVGSTPSAVVRFLTNAGPDCRRKPNRHHVTVQFLSFFSAVQSVEMPAPKAAGWLSQQPIRFDCDCEDHTYRFRYVASIGGFAFGRVETGFPKERNPLLEGVACKHVVRVMQQIDSGVVAIRFLAKMIDKARKHPTGKAQAQTSQKEADKIAKRQLSRPSQIKVKADRALKKIPATAKPGPVTKTTKPLPASPDPFAAMKAAMRMAGVSEEKIKQTIANLNASGA